MQVEAFGIHLNKTGGALYGMRIEAIQDRVRDDIPLDLLARLLVDRSVPHRNYTSEVVARLHSSPAARHAALLR